MPPACDCYDLTLGNFGTFIQTVQQNNAVQLIGVAFAVSVVLFAIFVNANSLTPWTWPSSFAEDAQILHELDNIDDARRTPALAAPALVSCPNHTSLRKTCQVAYVTHEGDGEKLEDSEAVETTVMSQTSFIGTHEIEEETIGSDEATKGDYLEQANEFVGIGGFPHQDNILREQFANTHELSNMILELGAWASKLVDIDEAITDV